MCGLTASGEAYCWGFNRWGQLGDGTTTDKSTPVAVAGGLQFASLWAGGRRTCGVTTSGTAYCWGEKAKIGTARSATAPASTELPRRQCFGSRHPDPPRSRV